MAQYKITLIGLENFLNPDHSVFEKMQLPDGIDKDTLIGSILMRCQEFEVLYSDPYFLMDAVNIWSRKHYWTFEKWVKAINIKYDPLFNYDRTEEWTDEHEGDYSKEGSSNASGNSKQTNNLANSSSGTVTHSEKAYNDTNYVGVSQDVSSSSGTDTGTVSNTFGNKNDLDESGEDSSKNTHTGRMYGNIGVTTSQQMLQSELDIARWNMYEHIADLFAAEFCIMVY